MNNIDFNEILLKYNFALSTLETQINILIKEYDKKMYKKEHPTTSYDDLLKSLGVTKNQFEFLLTKCVRKHYFEFIATYYDENYKIKEGLYFDEESKYIISSKIRPYFIKLRNYYCIDMLNEQVKIQDEEELMTEERENTMKLHSDFNINYHSLYLISKNIKKN